MPARNRLPMDAPAMTPYITRGMLGGKMGPITAEPAVMAALNPSSYPSFRMASISMIPSPDASATAEPVIPENIRDAMTFTCPRPPFHRPTRTLEKSNILSVTLLEFMIFAAKIKSGTASRIKLLYILLVKISTTTLGSIPFTAR